MRSLFDNHNGRNRSLVGQRLTRSAAPHPAADQSADETLSVAFDAAKRAVTERQLQALARVQPALPPGAEVRLLAVLEDARRAMPFTDHETYSGSGDFVRIARPAASIVHLEIGTDHLPDFAAPSANRQAGEKITIADAVLRQSRVCRAGAHLLTASQPKGIATGTGTPVFQQVPVGMSVLAPAPFAVVPDPDDPITPLALSALLSDERIDRPDDLKSLGFRISLTRAEQKHRKDDELLGAVLEVPIACRSEDSAKSD